MPVNRFDRTSYGEDSPEAAEHTERGGPEALGRFQAQLEQLGEYARFYLSAKKDAILVTVRTFALWSLVGIAAIAILCTLLSTAAVLAMLGVAQLIGHLLGERMWAGNLIAGFGFLFLVGGSLTAGLMIAQRSFRKKMVNKYAKRRQDQNARFGRDIVEPARSGKGTARKGTGASPPDAFERN